jgi:hypothetical protein
MSRKLAYAGSFFHVPSALFRWRVPSKMTVYCPRRLKKYWPKPIINLWSDCYPNLFDSYDLRLAGRQQRYHFVEWFAAVHLYAHYGLSVLLAKYALDKYPEKQAIIRQRLGENRLRYLRERHVGLPDIFAYDPKRPRRHLFAEVKGSGDRLRPAQRRNHRLIRRQLHVPVILIRFSYRRVSP